MYNQATHGPFAMRMQGESKASQQAGAVKNEITTAIMDGK
jgi:hypothetical protein